MLIRQIKYQQKHRQKQRTRVFLMGPRRKKGRTGYLNGDGCCLYCFEISPFNLENHHPWKKEDPNFTTTLCSKHHNYITRGYLFLLDEWF